MGGDPAGIRPGEAMLERCQQLGQDVTAAYLRVADGAVVAIGGGEEPTEQ